MCVRQRYSGPPAHVSSIHDDGEDGDNECPFHVVSPLRCCEGVLYLIRRSVSSVPSWVNVVRSSLVFGSPLVNLSEPRNVFGVFIRERDTSLAVVHLFTAEALVARHERRTGQLSAGTVDRLLVVVIRHCVFPFKEVGCCFLCSHYIYIIGKSKPQTPP